MTEGFDPYYKWLGIRPEEQPPNYYRLLGIAAFESDLEVISNAADQRMVHLRSYQAGQHAAASQRILNEVSAARICLLTPERKAEYDAALRAWMSGQVGSAPRADDETPFVASVSRSIKRRPRAQDDFTMVYMVVAFGVAAVGLLAFAIARPQLKKAASPAPLRSEESSRGPERHVAPSPAHPMPVEPPVEKKLPPKSMPGGKPAELPPAEPLPRPILPGGGAPAEKVADSIGMPRSGRAMPEQVAAGLDERFKAAKTPAQLRSAAEAAMQLAGRLAASGNVASARDWLQRARDAAQRAGADDLVRWAALQMDDLPPDRSKPLSPKPDKSP